MKGAKRKCSVCGKLFEPKPLPYNRVPHDDDYICSEKCMKELGSATLQVGKSSGTDLSHIIRSVDSGRMRGPKRYGQD